MAGGAVYGTRSKYIHSVGTIAKVEWQALNKDYDGLFQGADTCYARLSLAAQPNPKKDNIAPGVGIKCVRDGVDSGNFVAMYSVDGQDGSWNYFKNDFTNHIPVASDLKALQSKFAGQTSWITEVGLSDFARYSQSGSEVSTPNMPFKLRLHPTGEIAFPDEYSGDTFAQLTTIPSGSTLWQVWAYDTAPELGGKESHIANIVTSSEMVTTNFGDHYFFVRHQDYAEDLQLRPEWAQYSAKYGDSTNADDAALNLVKKAKCPFSFLH